MVPTVNNKHGEATFSYYASHLWNKPPECLGTALTLISHKIRL